MGKFRLQHLYRLAGCIAVLGCLVLGGVLFYVGFQDYWRDSLGSREFDRFNLALLVANTVSAERGPANSAMGATDVEIHYRTLLADKRRLTDDAVSQFAAAIAADERRFVKERELLDQFRDQLAMGRAAVDEVSALPPSRREGTQVANAIRRMFAAADTAIAMGDGLGQSIVSVYPQVSTEIMMASICSRLREYAGRFGSYVVMILTSPRDTNAELSLLLSSTHGQVTAFRGIISQYAQPYLGDPKIAAALRDVDRDYFDTALPYAWQIGLKGMEEPAIITTGAFTTVYVPGMVPVERLRDLIVERLGARIEASRDGARILVIIAAALTLLVAATLIALGIALNRWLFQPLLSARDQILLIAGGNLTDPAPSRRRSREMQEMFDGLRMLRESQRQHRALERERDLLTVRLKVLSDTDELTGLFNRRAIDAFGNAAIDDAMQTGEPVALLLFDVDRFKAVNDTYGHGVGDLVLQRLAETVMAGLRNTDIVARFGGEEFAILTRDTTREDALQLAERLRLALAEMDIQAGLDLHVTASFGVALWQPGMGDWTALVEIADRQLYRAKSSGRNRVCAERDDISPARQS